MNSTRAVDVSIQAVSPELIFDESTENGSVGAAGAAAASDAPEAGAAADAAIAALAVSGALAGAAAVVSEAAADAAAGAEASCAITVPALTPSSDPPSTRTSIIYAFFCFLLSPCLLLESVRAGFTGTNANDLFNRGDEDLAVADLACAGCTLYRFDGLVDDVVGDRCFDLHFRQEIDHVFGAAIQLRVALLAAEAFYLGHGDARDANSR